jgi:hypothetical protein
MAKYKRPALIGVVALGAAAAGFAAGRVAADIDAVTALTAVLVAVTAYYAWQNRRVVAEMKRATDLAIEPAIVLRPQILVPGKYVMFRAQNVGGGAAIGLQVEVRFEGAAADAEALAPYRWHAPSLAPHEHADLYARERPDAKMLEVAALVDRAPVVRLVGHCFDVLGRRHEIDAPLALADWWSVIQQAGQRFEEPTQRRLEQIADGVKNIARELERHRRSDREDSPLDRGSYA